MHPRHHEIQLKAALHEGRQIFGTLVSSTTPKSLQALAGMDLDCVMIDTEHIPMPWPDLGWMCHAYRGMGVVPLVRIPQADPFAACRALDVGAGGIIAAYIETAEEVTTLRGAVKVRPLKGRKLAETLQGVPLEPELAEYVRLRNAGNLLLVNIESVPAIEALDAILQVPELDAVLIGPHDLSCSLGVPEQYDHPRFTAAVQRIVEQARARKVGAGIHNLPRVEQEIYWMQQGMNLILHRSDIGLFRTGLTENLRTLRGACGEKAPVATQEVIL